MGERKLPRREREKLRQSQEMLEAARELFSEKGYHNVSMHQIAERSEFAIGTLYKFFKNKEELYRTLVMEKSTQIFGDLTAPLSADGDTLAVLEKYLANRARIAAEPDIHLAVPDAEIDRRLAAMEAKGEDAWRPADRERFVSQALQAYAAMTTSAARGAVRDVSQLKA